MLTIAANLWMILLLLMGGAGSCLAGSDPVRVHGPTDVALAPTADPGQVSPLDSGPGSLHLLYGVIEESTEETDNSDSPDAFGFSSPVPLFLPASPAPSAEHSHLGMNASIRDLRITCLRC